MVLKLLRRIWTPKLSKPPAQVTATYTEGVMAPKRVIPWLFWALTGQCRVKHQLVGHHCPTDVVGGAVVMQS